MPAKGCPMHSIWSVYGFWGHLNFACTRGTFSVCVLRNSTSSENFLPSNKSSIHGSIQSFSMAYPEQNMKKQPKPKLHYWVSSGINLASHLISPSGDASIQQQNNSHSGHYFDAGSPQWSHHSCLVAVCAGLPHTPHRHEWSAPGQLRLFKFSWNPPEDIMGSPREFQRCKAEGVAQFVLSNQTTQLPFRTASWIEKPRQALEQLIGFSPFHQPPGPLPLAGLMKTWNFRTAPMGPAL